MKKLTLVLALIVGGCGGSAQDADNWDFFEEYYAECVKLCEFCAQHNSECGIPEVTVEDCVLGNWDAMFSNNYCKNTALKAIEEKVCEADWYDQVCSVSRSSE